MNLANTVLSALRSLLILFPFLALGAAVVYAYEHTNKRRLERLAPPPEHYPPRQVPPDGLSGDEGSDAEEGEEEDEEEGGEEEEEEGGYNEEPIPAAPPLGEASTTALPTPTHPPVPRTRIVGPKKARSLARRNQRRAYNEFLHFQAAERARAQAAVAEEEEAKVTEEKERRKLVERDIATKKQEAKRIKIEVEKMLEEEEREDVEVLKRMVNRSGMWWIGKLAEGRGERWGKDVLKREGLVGKIAGGEDVGVITGEGWYVRLGTRELGALFGEMDKRGAMQWEDIIEVLEGTLRR